MLIINTYHSLFSISSVNFIHTSDWYLYPKIAIVSASAATNTSARCEILLFIWRIYPNTHTHGSVLRQSIFLFLLHTFASYIHILQVIEASQSNGPTLRLQFQITRICIFISVCFFFYGLILLFQQNKCKTQKQKRKEDDVQSVWKMKWEKRYRVCLNISNFMDIFGFCDSNRSEIFLYVA